MKSISVQNYVIPSLGFGTWKLSGRSGADAVEKAINIGYRHIDTATVYENETEVGNGIAASGINRGEIFLTTKVWMDNVRNGDLQKSADDSLKKLKTDYVDLLLIHWPVDAVPFREQLKALLDVQASGKARLIGVSNFTVAQMQEVVETIGAPIACNQVEYHPFLSQKPVLDYVQKHDMVLTAYSPLARGNILATPILEDLGRQYGKTLGQIALRWLIQQDRVAAIPKASSEEHMRENFDIFDFELTAPEMAAINMLARPDGRLVNPQWAPRWDQAA